MSKLITKVSIDIEALRRINHALHRASRFIDGCNTQGSVENRLREGILAENRAIMSDILQPLILTE